MNEKLLETARKVVRELEILGTDYANLDEVAALLREGKVTPHEALEMLKMEPEAG